MTRPLAALALALGLVLAGCGSKEDPVGPGRTQKLSVMLDFFPNADHVGLYAGRRRGVFEQAGLDVQVLAPPDPAAPLKLLAAGKVDIAISYEPEVLLARDKGAALVAIGAVVQKPLTSLIALPKGKVRSPRDLGGKTVGTAGLPYQSAYLETIARRAGARDVRQVDVGFNLNRALLSGRVDATLGGFSNYEGVQLRQAHRRPVIIPVDRAGIPTYDELVLVARRELLAQRPEAVRAFVQALGRGYAAVRRNPARGVEDLLAEVPDLRSTRDLQEASVRAALPAFFPSRGRPFGYQDPLQWRRYAGWMRANGLLEHPPRADAAITNEFLAGEGL